MKFKDFVKYKLNDLYLIYLTLDDLKADQTFDDVYSEKNLKELFDTKCDPRRRGHLYSRSEVILSIIEDYFTYRFNKNNFICNSYLIHLLTENHIDTNCDLVTAFTGTKKELSKILHFYGIDDENRLFKWNVIKKYHDKLGYSFIRIKIPNKDTFTLRGYDMMPYRKLKNMYNPFIDWENKKIRNYEI